MTSADLRPGRKVTLQEGKSSPVLIYTLYRREGFIAPAGFRITTPWVVQQIAWSLHWPSYPGSRCIRLFNVYHKYTVKKKVKCTLVQALRLCAGRTAHRGSRGIALLFHDHGTRRGWGVSVTPRPLFTPGKDPVPIVQEAGWAPGAVWTGA